VGKKGYFLTLFFLGASLVLVFRFCQVKKTETSLFSSKPFSFVFKPPSEALTGKLVLVKGQVEKEAREKEEFEKVDIRTEILQGEKLKTGKNSQTVVEFPDFAKFTLDSNSEITLVSLIPNSFLITQSEGLLFCELLQDNTPVSIRSLHALIVLSSGKAAIEVLGNEILVDVFEGKVKLALVSLDNKTHVWQLKAGQKALIDDVKRRVEIE